MHRSLICTDPEHLYLGGPFASVELGNSGTASMGIVDDKKPSKFFT